MKDTEIDSDEWQTIRYIVYLSVLGIIGMVGIWFLF
jgi:hypothetical protein